MRCGFLTLAAVLVLVLAACGSSAADSATRSAPASGGPSSTTSARTTSTSPRGKNPGIPCGPASARTLAGGPQARVYARGGFVYGCSARTHRTTRLGTSNRCIAASLAGPAAVAGELAAYGLERCGVDTGTGQVIVRRLSDGRALRTLAASQGPLRPESFQSVLAIAAKADGAVAWIARVTSVGGGGKRLEVLAADAGVAPRLLDSGAAIVPGSLALHGSRLSWADSGQTRSASLR